MARIFTGDFSTGDYSQWPAIQNHYLVSAGADYPSGTAQNYALDIQSNGDAGYCSRFEIRIGDTQSGTSERNEVQGAASVTVGTTAWYAFSVKFDPTFPSNQNTLGWLTFAQFKGEGTSPVISFGWALSPAPGQRNGYWYLQQNPQNTNPAGGWSFVGNTGYSNPIAEFPLELGKWHDIKMQAKWMQDSTGFIKLWRNGQPVTFSATYGGSGGGTTTFTGQTMAQNGGSPGQTVSTVQLAQGIYREAGVAPNEVIYITGTRAATDEASL